MMSALRAIFMTAGGGTTAVQAPAGSTLQAAIEQHTRHRSRMRRSPVFARPCLLDEDDRAKAGNVSAEDNEVLKQTAAERRNTSRLSCQIKLTPTIDDTVFFLPETRY